MASAEPSARGVLIIDEFGPDFPFGRRFRQQIHSTLKTETTQRYVLHSEFLDAARYNGPEYDSILDAYFTSKYQKMRISVIVTLGTEALKFASRTPVSEAALPKGSEIRFHELSVWELYRWQILAIATLIALQGLVITWLLYERRGRHIAEREARQHLLEVTKMDRAITASAMSASIAHELSQPLGAILSNTEAAEILLSANPLDLGQLKEICADIRRDDHRAVEIIKHLRLLLKRSELAVQDIDLAKVVSDFFAIIGPQAIERGVTLRAEPIPANVWVRADPVHLQQVLLNLAMNAIDAMQDTPARERTLKLQVRQQNSEVTVSLADTGPGIPQDKIKSIFDPFITTKQQGTGLGLSICRTIINTYGGAIWAENGAKCGAIFHFTLKSPRAAAA
jgi:signal transduction histidine kinase